MWPNSRGRGCGVWPNSATLVDSLISHVCNYLCVAHLAECAIMASREGTNQESVSVRTSAREVEKEDVKGNENKPGKGNKEG